MLPTCEGTIYVGRVHGSFPHRCRNGRAGPAPRWGRFSCVPPLSELRASFRPLGPCDATGRRRGHNHRRRTVECDVACSHPSGWNIPCKQRIADSPTASRTLFQIEKSETSSLDEVCDPDTIAIRPAFASLRRACAFVNAWGRGSISAYGTSEINKL